MVHFFNELTSQSYSYLEEGVSALQIVHIPGLQAPKTATFGRVKPPAGGRRGGGASGSVALSVLYMQVTGFQNLSTVGGNPQSGPTLTPDLEETTESNILILSSDVIKQGGLNAVSIYL